MTLIIHAPWYSDPADNQTVLVYVHKSPHDVTIQGEAWYMSNIIRWKRWV
jgi:hypothetical protein